MTDWLARWRYPVIVALCCWLMRWRARVRYRDLYPWAEDGALYLARALNLGWKCVTATYAGYYQGFSQGMIYVFSQASLERLPVLTFWFSVGVFALTASLFSRPTYRSLVRSDWLRAGCCLALGFAPGLDEITGNMANLQWNLLLCGGLIACKDLREDLSVLDLAVMCLIGSCAGAGVTLLLPLGVRAAVRWGQHREARHLGDVGCFIIILSWSIANVLARDVEPPIVLPALRTLTEFIATTFSLRFLLEPVLGTRVSSHVVGDTWYWVGASLLLGGFFCYQLWQIGRRQHPVFVAWICSTQAVYLLALISRPQLGEFLRLLTGHDRYAVPAGQCALIAWVACIGRQSKRSLRPSATLAGVAFLAIYVFAAQSRLEIGAFPGQARDWPLQAQIIRTAVRREEPASVPGRPDGWSIEYKGKAKRPAEASD